MSTIRRGFRDRATVVAYADGVDPVTRRPTGAVTYPAGTDPHRMRLVARTDRTVVRSSDDPSRVLIDHDALIDPDLAPYLDLGVELHHVDGRRFVVAGGVVLLGRVAGDAVYGRVPCVQAGRVPEPPVEP